MPSKQNIDLQPLLEAQQNHLGIAMADAAAIDAKALGIAAANIAVLVYIAQSLDLQGWLMHAALIVPYLVSLTYTILAILPKDYIGPGVDLVSSPEYLTMDKDTIIAQLLSNTQAAIANNDRLNKKRWRYCAASLAFTAIGTCAIFVILVV